MKINNKGYLLVEIIVASTLAMALAFFLIDLTINIKNKNEDYVVETLLETDKAVITKEVMNDISNYKLVSVKSDNYSYVDLVFEGDKKKRITVDKEKNAFIYGNYDGKKYIDDNDYFYKEFRKEITVSSINIENKCYYDNEYKECVDDAPASDGLLRISVVAKTLYSDYNYGIELNINYKVSELKTVVVPPEPDDPSGANHPNLVTGMIPIMYDGTKWVKADTLNLKSTYGWYDYGSKKWANAVLVKENKRSHHTTSSPGTEVPEDDILAYYVWIPRYKYKLWNAKKEKPSGSYISGKKIDVVFENEKETTGTVKCQVDNLGKETCEGAENGAYYTHPAFTFGNLELSGIWVGKFELVGESDFPMIKPNMRANCLGSISYFFDIITKFSNDTKRYGVLNTEADSHMMKNIEWGAIAYLTNSKYGRCNDRYCEEVTINNYRYENTGLAGKSVSADRTSYIGDMYRYNTEGGFKASTTGNIYGVYDTSGSAEELVMANMLYTDGTHVVGEDVYHSSGYTGKLIEDGYVTEYEGKPFPDEKYYDKYEYIESSRNYSAGHLGDATIETLKWNDDSANFFGAGSSWLHRGGYSANREGAGPFRFLSSSGGGKANRSTRAILVKII